MTDKTFDLEPGHQRIVNRGPKPADGWDKDGSVTLEAADSASFPALDIVEPPPDPDPDPDPTPTPGALRGFGKAIRRSAANLTTVNNLAGLRSAAGAGGRNVKVDVPAGTIWSLGGQNLTPKSGTAIDFGNLTLMGGSVFLAGVSDVFIDNCRSHAGDQFGTAADLDPFNLNGNSAPVRNIYVRNSQFLWGPDTNSAILGDVQNVTFERVVFAEGLFDSKHPEAPHSLGPNVASTDPGTPAQRITFIECLVHTNESRNFRLIGVGQAELIGCTVYNHHEGPQGCPASAVLLGCTWKKGPNALGNTFLFRAQDGGHGAFSVKPNTVFEHGGQAIGFTHSGVDPKVRANAAPFTSSEPEPSAPTAFATVQASAGAQPADKQLTRLRANLKNGTGVYVNGIGRPGSYTGLL